MRTEHVLHLWPQVEPLIAKVLARDAIKRWRPDDFLPMFLADKLRLWVAWNHAMQRVDAVVVTEVVDYPLLKEFRILYVSGGNMKAWIERAIATLEGFAGHLGCHVVMGFSRKGWMRIGSGYRETGVMFEKAL